MKWLFPLLLGTASAQTLLPLDSRPATRVLPALIAGLKGQGVSVPPAELLGRAGQGADFAALESWLAAQPPQPLVIALDAWAYGGLVQSRTSPLTEAQVMARLERLKAWHAQTQQPIYAFLTLPRAQEATNRQRNLAVARQMLAWAGEGVFKELHVAWDDALPGSPAPAEGQALAQQAPSNVRVYPGADEVLSMLVARALAPVPKTVRIVYSDPKKATEVMKYEGIPLTQSAENHAKASGFTLVEEKADLTLYVYNGGNSRQAALQVSALLRRGPVAVADVAQVNLGNARLWNDLSTLRQAANLRALAAWGTPGNNLGSALAHAKLTLESGISAQRQDALLAREYGNDVIYSAKLRAELRKYFPEKEMNTPAAQAKLLELARQQFPLRMGLNYQITEADLPWGRSFEWDFTLQGQPF